MKLLQSFHKYDSQDNTPECILHAWVNQWSVTSGHPKRYKSKFYKEFYYISKLYTG